MLYYIYTFPHVSISIQDEHQSQPQVVARLKSMGLDWGQEANVFNAGNAAARLLDPWSMGLALHPCYIYGQAVQK
jgi:hypothetical protein